VNSVDVGRDNVSHHLDMLRLSFVLVVGGIHSLRGDSEIDDGRRLLNIS
jgi:hypothetical protein